MMSPKPPKNMPHKLLRHYGCCIGRMRWASDSTSRLLSLGKVVIYRRPITYGSATDHSDAISER